MVARKPLRPALGAQLCPCGTGASFNDCCQPYLSGNAIAPTAEALMRSRYSAFATQNVDYLVQTHHPSSRTLNERTELMQACQQTTWKKLTILHIRQGQAQDFRGIVEFMAVYQATEFGQLHERSNFVKESGRWFYADGTILPPIMPKRGEPCWCGSEKKFKRCHG